MMRPTAGITPAAPQGVSTYAPCYLEWRRRSRESEDDRGRRESLLPARRHPQGVFPAERDAHGVRLEGYGQLLLALGEWSDQSRCRMVLSDTQRCRQGDCGPHCILER